MANSTPINPSFDLLFDIKTLEQLVKEYRQTEKIMETLSEMIHDHDLTHSFTIEALRQDTEGNEDIY